MNHRKRRTLLGFGIGVIALAIAIAIASILSGGGSDPHGEPGTKKREAKRAADKPRAAAAFPAGVKLVRGDEARRVRAPILMYHVINTPPPGTALPKLWVSGRDFSAQMRALEAAGYTGVTQSQLFAAWRRGAPIPAKPLVVSFDDGYTSQYATAFPILRKLDWPGVVNVTVRNVGPSGLTKRMLKEMHGAGWDVGAHTITHPDLTGLAGSALRREVAGSRGRLEKMLGVRVEFFCYPAGEYDRTTEASVRDAGFAGATTVERGMAGPGDDPFALSRVRVDGGESPAALMSDLRGMR